MALANCNALPEPDYLYHLGLHTGQDLAGTFGDLKAVIIMGSADRAHALAHRFASETQCIATQVGKTERYHLYKVGPALFASHGIGQASLSLVLHEVAKLLHYSGAGAVPVIRVGTSGGVGVDPGTVVITSAALNGELREEFTLPVLGEVVRMPSDGFAPDLIEALTLARGNLQVVVGKTLTADCFYEGQGRLDGALCTYTEADKMAFIQRLHDLGVRNVEMESNYLGAFGKRIGLPVACLCVCLLNRMEGDQVRLSSAELEHFTAASGEIVLRWLHAHLVSLCTA